MSFPDFHPRGFARPALLALFTTVAPANAQVLHDNVFRGEDWVTAPISFKAGCGGDVPADLAQIRIWMQAFPEDALAAEMQESVDFLFHSNKSFAPYELHFGRALTQLEKDGLCAAALPIWAWGHNIRNAGR
jgi:hypothetical protein